MHKLNCGFLLFGLTVVLSVCGPADLTGQTTVFQTGFEYAFESSPLSPSDLNGATGQIGSWSGDDFPEGIGNFAPDTIGFEDHPDNGSRLLWLDRPTTSTGDPGAEIISLFADLTDDIFTAGATFSFEAGTRRTGGNNNKDWDLIGLDNNGNESFHLRVGTNNNGGDRMGFVSEAGTSVTFDLPTVVGEDGANDLDNIGGTPFDNDEIGKITVNTGVNGYSFAFEHGRNSYTTDTLSYNGPATELSQIQITYSASDNTGVNSGYVLDNLLVSGRKVSDGLTFGDFNLDGNVDMGDFGILAANFGTGTEFSQGDNNFDGSVNLQDFNEFKALYNAALGGGAAAVPEPSSLALMSLAGAVVLLAGRTCRARE